MEKLHKVSSSVDNEDSDENEVYLYEVDIEKKVLKSRLLVDEKSHMKPKALKERLLLDEKSDMKPIVMKVQTELNRSKRKNEFEVKIQGAPVTVIIDSGATINVMDVKSYNSLSMKPKLEQTNTRIYPYRATEPLKAKGVFYADIEANNRNVLARVYVVEGDASCLLSLETSIELDLLRIGPVINNISNINNINEIKLIPDSTQNIIDKHSEIFKGAGRLRDYKLRLHIDKSIPPVQQPVRRIPFHTRQKVSAELKRLLKLDIIEPVNGPTTWITPIVTVPKPKNDSLRLCLDMRRPNLSILREKHPIPKLEEVLPNIADAKFFTKIDLKEGYHQILLHEDSRDITTFITHEGLYRFKVLLYGVNSGFEHFQKIIEQVIAGCKGCFNISDDIFIYGNTQGEHDEHLDSLLKVLKEAGLKLNLNKCEFSKSKIIFSGYQLTTDGIAPDQSKVDAVKAAETPKTQKEVRSFLGLVNFCNRFIPGYSTISAPLRKLTKKGQPFVWDASCKEAFEELKLSLMNANTMAYYRPNAETRVIVDASPVGLGAILVQTQENGEERPVAYGSRALTPTEQRFCQTEREALAVLFGCTHFHFFIYDRRFTISTDHKSLLKILSPKSEPSARIQRWLLRLQAYQYDLEHKPGENNPADVLSRSPLKFVDVEFEKVTMLKNL